MKTKLLVLITFSILINVNAQIKFLGHIVMENVNSMPYTTYIENVDMDGDGDLDLISIGNYGIKWFENTDGTNSNLISHQISDLSGIYINAKDFDKDGDMDIIFHNTGRPFYIENIDGNNDFAEPVNLTSTIVGIDKIYSISIEDLDKDEDLDIIISYRTEASFTSLGWLENIDGQGTFTVNEFAKYSNSTSMTTADIDGDNDIDIITFNYRNQEIEWFVNDGEQNFIKQTIISASVNNNGPILLKDIDNDNDLDLIISEVPSYSVDSVKLRILKNDGLGNFSEYYTVNTDVKDISRLHANDMDADGDIDIAFSSRKNNTVAWFQNLDGLGTLGNYKILNDNAKGAGCVISYDYDSDGDIDILSASQTDHKIALYENLDSFGNFSEEQTLTTSINNPQKVLSIDLDGDDDLDVIASDINNTLTWYENLDGKGTFGSQTTIGSGITSIINFAAKDFDNDGDIDIVTGDTNSDSSPLMWFENLDGQGKFSLPKSIGGTSFLKEIKAGDIDNDGDNDFIYNIGWSREHISWRENVDGKGDFSEYHIIETTVGNGGKIVLEDINNDQKIDVVLQSRGNIAWYINDGAGNFTENIISSAFYRGFSFSVDDIDKDGDFDIVSIYQSGYYGNNHIGWYENLDGLGNFGDIQIIDNNTLSVMEIYTEDLNNDGFVDIISRSLGGKIFWYEHTDGLGVFTTKKIIIERDSYINSIDLGDINADGKTDILSTYSLDPYGHEYEDDKILWYKNLGLGSNKINGIVKLDASSNGCENFGQPLSNVMVIADSNTETLGTFTLSNGYYQLFPDIGTYTTRVASSLNNYYSTNPNSYDHIFTEINTTEIASFCATPLNSIDDISISIFPISEARPGFEVTYQIVYKNTGTTVLSGNIVYKFEGSKLNFLNSTQPPSEETTDSLLFDFTNLQPFETKTINLTFNLLPPPTSNINDVLIHLVTINPNSGEQQTFAFNQLVIGSYDPNDIQVLEGKQILYEHTDKYLHYIIRFQNTGTASAINVQIENELDSKLDWTTMELESLSHNGYVKISNGNHVSFAFDNIFLPDSTKNEPNSHGYITYKIKPKKGIAIGDIILNKADIFFDFNPAITTNTVNTKIIVEDDDIDDDNDGILDNLDECSNTPLNTLVDIKGCILFPENNLVIETISETCPDKDNAKIIITAIETYDYVATLNGLDYNFTSDLTIDNLFPGNYELCISVPSESYEQCYTIALAEGTTISGKSSSTKSGKVSVNIEKGTAPYSISINGHVVLQTELSLFSVNASHGDFVEVGTSKSCEGKLSKTIELSSVISASPNPTYGTVEINLPVSQKEVTIDLYTIHSQLISTRSYPIENGKVKMNLKDKPNGVYFVKVYIAEPLSLKIVKQ
ncbi:FG-GAP-like repeat-containing protein [Algibacter sp. 2305UL17-15]|uniref:FG-GAP-like repeat-containing protein n=1 Tax=Algibacter sp. 2305UL17-15 TaxID=3231268 RepID=UPI00345A6FF3